MSIPQAKAPKASFGLRVIGGLKLLSAGLLMAVGFGIFDLMDKDTADMLKHFVHKLHLDPENKLIISLLASVSTISEKDLKAIDAGTFLYALVYIVEGVGLLLAKHWAEYLTIFITASLIPVEIYEIVRKAGGIRITVLVINIAILAYLLYQLRTDQRAAEKQTNPGVTLET